MARYSVKLTRVREVRESTYVTVEASSVEEAEEEALDRAYPADPKAWLETAEDVLEDSATAELITERSHADAD